MTETVLIKNQEEFNKFKNSYWKSSSYHRYHVENPLKFPCVAVESTTADGLVTLTEIDTYIYPEDFRGELISKQEVLNILKQDQQNLDLSWDSCDSRYIEKIEKL